MLEGIHHSRIHTRVHGSWHCPSCSPAPGWQSPSNSQCQPQGDLPFIDKLLFAGRSCAIPSERLMLNASQNKNRIWHRDSFHINLLVLNTKTCLKLFAGKFISLLTELSKCHSTAQPTVLCINFFFHFFSAGKLKWKIPAGDPGILIVPWRVECIGRVTSETSSDINELTLFESPISSAF